MVLEEVWAALLLLTSALLYDLNILPPLRPRRPPSASVTLKFSFFKQIFSF